ncbi:hypothetical protein K2P97_07165 [bacterium]|nr:hypothetical protein [bacterium]
MASAVVVYFFIEKSMQNDFSNERKPYVLSQEATTQAVERSSAFKNCGGIKVVDYFFDSKTHIRISFWNDKNGYAEWSRLTPQNTQLREKYHSQNYISAELQGPFEANEYAT